MAALLVSIAIMGIVMSVAMPVWRQAAQREREAELIFRAGQYARAVALFQRKYANAYPPDVDVLIAQRFLRKKYRDPITGRDFRILSPAEVAAAPGMPSTVSAEPGRVGQSGVGSPPRSKEQGGTSQRSAFGQPGSQSASGFGQNQPRGPGREVNQSGVAGVVSRSDAKSIRIFKGRQYYNQWIVTMEDVLPKRFLTQPQPGQPEQPGQQPTRPGVPSRTPGQRGTPSSPMPR
jgi:type II secretory pathway pseudopilin PulG